MSSILHAYSLVKLSVGDYILNDFTGYALSQIKQFSLIILIVKSNPSLGAHC